MTSAYALYDFGIKHNKTAATWNKDVQDTYKVGSSGQFMLFAAAMITWAHRCENENLPLCSDNKARRWLSVSETQWKYQVVCALSSAFCGVVSSVAQPASATEDRACCRCELVYYWIVVLGAFPPHLPIRV